MAVDWARYASYRGVALPFLSTLHHAPAASPAAAQIPALLAALQGAPSERHQAIVLQHVRRDVLAVLGLAGTARLDDEQGLRDAGLDSLMALELKNRLQASTGQPLPSTLAFDYPTTAALAAFIGDALGRGAAEAAPSAAAAIATQDLDEMSDEEAEALLAEELAALKRGKESDPGSRTSDSGRRKSEYSRG
jgi:acyl carrier protein